MAVIVGNRSNRWQLSMWAAIVDHGSNGWQSSMWEQSMAIVDVGSNGWQSSQSMVIVDVDCKSLAIAAIDGNRRCGQQSSMEAAIVGNR